jgi:hypothetical protein
VPALRWNFAAFDAPGTRLITVENGQLQLRELDGTRLAGPLPVATVEHAGGPDWNANGGALVIRSYDAANKSFGAPTVLVASAPGVASYYPSFSPDSQWVVFTRTSTNSYDNPGAQTWLVKADGTKPPVQLATANLDGDLTNSWARWVPFGQTFGPATSRCST